VIVTLEGGDGGRAHLPAGPDNCHSHRLLLCP
jgi:hypothetical protein